MLNNDEYQFPWKHMFFANVHIIILIINKILSAFDWCLEKEIKDSHLKIYQVFHY